MAVPSTTNKFHDWVFQSNLKKEEVFPAPNTVHMVRRLLDMPKSFPCLSSRYMTSAIKGPEIYQGHGCLMYSNSITMFLSDVTKVHTAFAKACNKCYRRKKEFIGRNIRCLRSLGLRLAEEDHLLFETICCAKYEKPVLCFG